MNGTVPPAEEWDKENCCVNGYDASCDTEDLVYIIEEMWPDIVMESAAIAARWNRHQGE